MDIMFKTKKPVRNSYRITDVDGYGTINFKKGVFITSDKKLIKKLLNHPVKKRDYELVTNSNIVADYLLNKQTDKLTEKILSEITIQGVIELGKYFESEETQPDILRIELEGQPIDGKVREIIDYYQSKKPNIKSIKVEEDEEEKVQEVSNKESSPVSKDMNVKKALEYISNCESKEEVEEFVSEDEDRKTILNAVEDYE